MCNDSVSYGKKILQIPPLLKPAIENLSKMKVSLQAVLQLQIEHQISSGRSETLSDYLPQRNLGLTISESDMRETSCFEKTCTTPKSGFLKFPFQNFQPFKQLRPYDL